MVSRYDIFPSDWQRADRLVRSSQFSLESASVCVEVVVLGAVTHKCNY